MNFLGAMDTDGVWYPHPAPTTSAARVNWGFYLIEGKITVVEFPLRKASVNKVYPDLDTALVAIRLKMS